VNFILGLAAVALIVLLLVDAFETTVLPRRVTHRFRFARLYYFNTWRIWRALALRIRSSKRRESFLSVFGPLSLLGLLCTWVIGLIVGFAILHLALGTMVHMPDSVMTFPTYIYWSGGTFFTLGYGDITPTTPIGRILAVAEAGMGFGFLALIIGYLPVIYQTFSKREALIALLDARAGSPPSAAQFLIRLGRAHDVHAVDSFLAEWERWSAELLESHLSFPVLSYYRSQHDNQSWLSALTAILDTCAVFISTIKGCNRFQAELTFAMSRHAAVDLALIFKKPPELPEIDRLPQPHYLQLRETLTQSGIELHDATVAGAKLAELREMYEPFVSALSQRFLFALPEFIPAKPSADNWQRSSWKKRAPELASLPIEASVDGHFK
jgi:voltage-gated potassium channel Kch